MLELKLKNLDHVHGDTSSARNRDTTMAIGGDHFFHFTIGDSRAHRCSAISGDDDAVVVTNCENSRSVRSLQRLNVS